MYSTKTVALLAGWMTVLFMPASLYAENPFITGRTQTIAFGGGPGPENTVAAVRKSLELGVPMVELDVRLTKDGVPVHMHDADVSRTTNGKGNIADMTFAKVRQLDAGASNVEATTLKRHYAGERIPTLKEMIETVGERAVILLDLKVPEVARPVVQTIKQADAFDRIVFRVPNDREIRRLRGMDSRAQFVLRGPLRENDLTKLLRRLKKLAVVAYTPDEWQRITPRLVKRFHSFGIAVWVVGSNRPSEMVRMVEAGVDGMFTESPTILLQIVRDSRKVAPSPNQERPKPYGDEASLLPRRTTMALSSCLRLQRPGGRCRFGRRPASGTLSGNTATESSRDGFVVATFTTSNTAAFISNVSSNNGMKGYAILGTPARSPRCPTSVRPVVRARQ